MDVATRNYIAHTRTALHYDVGMAERFGEGVIATHLLHCAVQYSSYVSLLLFCVQQFFATQVCHSMSTNSKWSSVFQLMYGCIMLSAEAMGPKLISSLPHIQAFALCVQL